MRAIAAKKIDMGRLAVLGRLGDGLSADRIVETSSDGFVVGGRLKIKVAGAGFDYERGVPVDGEIDRLVAVAKGGKCWAFVDIDEDLGTVRALLADGLGTALDHLLAGADIIRGSSWNDTLCGLGGDDVAAGRKGRDVLAGGDGDDRLSGGRGADRLSGEAGDDRLVGGRGRDRLDGGEGSDLLMGGAGDNVLDGGNGDDHLAGAAGADLLAGGDGSDVVDGGEGNDTLTGGAGSDAFVFRARLDPTANVDAIADFAVGADRILLDAKVFDGVEVLDAGSALLLGDGCFVVGAGATEAGHRIIYDDAAGALLFDADGSGGGGAVLFAVLAKGLKLDSGSFFVV